jgi:PadR family transcriptional regulator PadR
MEDIEKQLRKGVLDIIILSLVCEGDMYGYELMKELESRSRGYYSLKEGSLYPVLYRLEDQELIEHYRVENSGRRAVPRKYYRITDAGRVTMKAYKLQWTLFVEHSNPIIGG